MRWPNKTVCKRISVLWAHAHDLSNRYEAENAYAALKRLQADEGLSDCELAFIAESRIDFDHTDDTSEQPLDLLVLILGLFDVLHIIFPTFQLGFVVALWPLHAAVYDQFLHTPRLLLQSAKPGCGKTALSMCLDQLISVAYYSDDITPAVIYHKLQDGPGTRFLLDEIENSSLSARTARNRPHLDP